MDELYLMAPSIEMEKQAMEYRQEYLDCSERHTHGSFGFQFYSNYEEWLKDIEL